jgi:Protein of unknown function with HXXEE motif
VHRTQFTFGALIAAQALHSIEEYSGRLYDIFPPARFMCGLVSRDLRLGFIIINVAFVAFGVWCYLWPLRNRWTVAPILAWLWAAIEAANGIGHPLWSLWQRAYQPGVATAPLLLVLSLTLGYQLYLRPVSGPP